MQGYTGSKMSYICTFLLGFVATAGLCTAMYKATIHSADSTDSIDSTYMPASKEVAKQSIQHASNISNEDSSKHLAVAMM